MPEERNVARGGALLLVVLASVACGASERRKGAPIEITSASAAGKATNTPDLVRLERERDEARAQLQEEVARHDEDRARFAADTEGQRSRKELAVRVWTLIDAVDAHLGVLEDKAVRAPSKRRRNMEKGIAEARRKLAVLDLAAREIVSDDDIDWPRFQNALENAILDLQDNVRKITE